MRPERLLFRAIRELNEKRLSSLKNIFIFGSRLQTGACLTGVFLEPNKQEIGDLFVYSSRDLLSFRFTKNAFDLHTVF